MYCFSWGSHLLIVFSTQPGTAFVTMQTTPKACATLMALMTACCRAVISLCTAGSSGRGWLNQLGTLSRQSSSEWFPASGSAEFTHSSASARCFFKRLRIQLVGQSVSSQSKKKTVRRLGNAPGSGRGSLINLNCSTAVPDPDLMMALNLSLRDCSSSRRPSCVRNKSWTAGCLFSSEVAAEPSRTRDLRLRSSELTGDVTYCASASGPRLLGCEEGVCITGSEEASWSFSTSPRRAPRPPRGPRSGCRT
mmetsp:Transcript_75853/g.136854  ORF Transcript_75853/g.136854 Transcript_75853/m.136854 type:complete len:250 (-) Transcript_75853:1116-1865(-)